MKDRKDPLILVIKEYLNSFDYELFVGEDNWVILDRLWHQALFLHL